MTETTATRLAEAIDKQREKVWHSWRVLRAIQIAPNVDDDAHIAQQQAAKKAVDAALTRLEKLCVAQGRWEEQGTARKLTVDIRGTAYSVLNERGVELRAEIEALLREET